MLVVVVAALSILTKAETACQKLGGSVLKLEIFIHSEYIQHRLLVFNTFFMTTFNFGGLSPPYQKVGGSNPLCPPCL